MSEKITFILGAGSNKDYGFPLGKELYRATIKDIENNEDLVAVSKTFNLFGQPYTDDVDSKMYRFKEELKASQSDSLDLFAYRFRQNNSLNYERICKYIISYYIAKWENEIDIFDPNNENHWYKILWQNIQKLSFEELVKGKYTFITFNYDRSLEYYLSKVIYYTYFNNSRRSFAEIDKIRQEYFPIFHVYGQLAQLTYNNELFYGYKAEFSEDMKKRHLIDKVKIGVNNINLLLTDRENNSDLNEIIAELKSTDIIIFLGFGFDELNLKILNIKGIETKKVGYARGLSPKRVKELKSIYDISCNTIPLDNIVEYLKSIEIF